MAGFNIPAELRNDKLRLSLLKEGDFDLLYQVAADPLVWEQHPCKDRYKEEVFRLFFEEALRSASAYAIFNAHTGELIGSTRFYDLDKEHAQVAIGYTFFARKYWGGVYNGAVKRLMLDHAFRFADEVLFHVGADNIRSQKAVLRLGAEKTKEFERDANGTKTSHYEYCLGKEAWLNRTAGITI